MLISPLLMIHVTLSAWGSVHAQLSSASTWVGCTPFVWSIICVGSANVLGSISSTVLRTPKDLSVAMFAREGMADGLKVGTSRSLSGEGDSGA